MSETIGNQAEAEEIFSFVLRYNAWKVMERNNEFAAYEFKRHAELLELHRRFPDDPWYRHPGSLRCHYAYGPNIEKPELPEGWKFLAAGVSRRAYLSPSGVVYKVQRNPESDYQGNKGEHETAERVRKSGDVRGAYIPRTSLYKVPGSWVIALEYMNGIRGDEHWEMYCYPGERCRCAFPGYVRCASAIKRELQNKLGLSDLHNENVLWVPSQRVWAVVDLGLAN
ncbi:hypothetical protein SEA_PHREDRICK_264 [Streptomyces phage Phredrick]|nr:hypothetical protein SEA_PHREDRICK_264 [Streptomyces phage Phredrick]